MTAAGGAPREADAGETFPWDAVLHVGLGLLRLDPNTFWRLTPREFALLAGAGRPRAAVPTRAALEALAHRYPDGDDDGQRD